MSRIGKLPVLFGKDITPSFNSDDRFLEIKGKSGSLKRRIPAFVDINIDSGKIIVVPKDEEAKTKALWGLTRKLISNMVEGITNGFSVDLEITGVGYKAAVDGKILRLALGFSHDVYVAFPADITVVCEKPTSIKISGIDLEKVTQIAAEIRSIRPPEPYKGKGIRYKDEVVRRKVGKKK